MDRYARCKSLDAAWELAEFLTAHVRDCRFEVHMPSRIDFDVHCCIALPADWRAYVQKLVNAWKHAKLNGMAIPSPAPKPAEDESSLELDV